MATLKQAIQADAELRELAAAGNYPAVAEALNAAPMVDNPTPRGRVPAPVMLKQVMGLVPAAEMAKVYRFPGFIDDLRRALDSNDHEYLGVLLQIALADTAITQATAAQLQPLLTAQVDDPAWAAQVPGQPRWQAAGLAGPVDAAQVQAAAHE